MYICTYNTINIVGTVELRKKWIQSIANVDERFLRMIDALYDSYQKEDDIDSYDRLPDIAKRLIDQGLDDVAQGRVTPHEQVMAEFRKKYKLA